MRLEYGPHLGVRRARASRRAQRRLSRRRLAPLVAARGVHGVRACDGGHGAALPRRAVRGRGERRRRVWAGAGLGRGGSGRRRRRGGERAQDRAARLRQPAERMRQRPGVAVGGGRRRRHRCGAAAAAPAVAVVGRAARLRLRLQPQAGAGAGLHLRLPRGEVGDARVEPAMAREHARGGGGGVRRRDARRRRGGAPVAAPRRRGAAQLVDQVQVGVLQQPLRRLLRLPLVAQGRQLRAERVRRRPAACQLEPQPAAQPTRLLLERGVARTQRRRLGHQPNLARAPAHVGASIPLCHSGRRLAARLAQLLLKAAHLARLGWAWAWARAQAQGQAQAQRLDPRWKPPTVSRHFISAAATCSYAADSARRACACVRACCSCARCATSARASRSSATWLGLG